MLTKSEDVVDPRTLERAERKHAREPPAGKRPPPPPPPSATCWLFRPKLHQTRLSLFLQTAKASEQTTLLLLLLWDFKSAVLVFSSRGSLSFEATIGFYQTWGGTVIPLSGGVNSWGVWDQLPGGIVIGNLFAVFLPLGGLKRIRGFGGFWGFTLPPLAALSNHS